MTRPYEEFVEGIGGKPDLGPNVNWPLIEQFGKDTFRKYAPHLSDEQVEAILISDPYEQKRLVQYALSVEPPLRTLLYGGLSLAQGAQFMQVVQVQNNTADAVARAYYAGDAWGRFEAIVAGINTLSISIVSHIEVLDALGLNARNLHARVPEATAADVMKQLAFHRPLRPELRTETALLLAAAFGGPIPTTEPRPDTPPAYS